MFLQLVVATFIGDSEAFLLVYFRCVFICRFNSFFSAMLYSLVFVRDVNISFYYICKEEKKSILKKILLLEVTLVH